MTLHSRALISSITVKILTIHDSSKATSFSVLIPVIMLNEPSTEMNYLLAVMLTIANDWQIMLKVAPLCFCCTIVFRFFIISFLEMLIRCE